MPMFSIAIAPRAHIGYCFVVLADNQMHALSVLSYNIRMCMKQGIKNHRFEDTLRMVRKWWRIHTGSSNHLWPAVQVMTCTAISASYDEPLVADWFGGNIGLSHTSNHHRLHLQLSPRSKGLSNQGQKPTGQ